MKTAPVFHIMYFNLLSYAQKCIFAVIFCFVFLAVQIGSAADYYINNETLSVSSEIGSFDNMFHVQGSGLLVSDNTDIRAAFTYTDGTPLHIQLKNSGGKWVVPQSSSMFAKENIYVTCADETYLAFGQWSPSDLFTSFTGTLFVNETADVRIETTGWGFNVDLAGGTLQFSSGMGFKANVINISKDSTLTCSDWLVLENQTEANLKSITGTRNLTVLGNGYVAFNGYGNATKYEGKFIVGTSVTTGGVHAEIGNAFNPNAGGVILVNGTLNFNNNTQTLYDFEYRGGTLENFADSGDTPSLTINHEFKFNSSETLNFATSLAGVGSVVVDGGGTLNFTGNTSYTGDTTITNGTLSFTGSKTLNNLSGTNTGNLSTDAALTLSTGTDKVNTYTGSINVGTNTITVSGEGRQQLVADSITASEIIHQSGMLDVSGQLNSSLTISGGEISPGITLGSLNVGENFSLGADATLRMDIGGITTELNDSLTVLGTVSFDPESTIFLNFAESYIPNMEDTVEIQLPSGMDSDLILNILNSEFYNLFSYNPDTGVLSASVAGVPEPSTLCLFLLAMAGVLYLKKCSTSKNEKIS
ncbi:MAG: PEP-CTERM sorting domain-containing protein [Planctomycetia bacterium]|nr:PEP-CTERM sorting domain-containing protein [Planctomycetia bacterium]